MSEITLHEAIYTTRAMRRLKPDPIPDQDLLDLIEAATMGPSAGNNQEWAFIVVTDPEMRARVGEVYRAIGNRIIRDTVLANSELPAAARRVYEGAMHLVEHMAEAPALVLPVITHPAPSDAAGSAAYWGSVFGAVQNLMLAARAKGIGATLTTIHKYLEPQMREVLGLPDDHETVALIPLGYPQGKWGRPKRAPAAQLTHWDRWGNRR